MGVDHVYPLDLSAANPDVTPELAADPVEFTRYINGLLSRHRARYAVGGYAELRPMYGRSGVFGKEEEEPRRLHLGLDIWGRPRTKIMAPWDGIVHSFAFNNAPGDYGATIILTHLLNDPETGASETWHTLYGHLSLQSLGNLHEGAVIRKGDAFADMGLPFENGQWPPHLHFQIIRDMEGMKGDYPGVCAESRRDHYLSNCPDPSIVMHFD